MRTADERAQIDWQWPLSDVHSIMMVNSSQPGVGVGCTPSSFHYRAGVFKESMGAIGTEEEEGYRTGPPGYIGWRNSFLGIDSGAPYTFKNTGTRVGGMAGERKKWQAFWRH